MTSEYMVFVLEYCNANSLFEEIKKRGPFPEAEAKAIMKQLLVGFSVRVWLFRRCIRTR